MLPPTAIVVLNWNGWQDTIELLSSLKDTTYVSLMVIVIDNASTDQSAVQIKQWFAKNQVSYTIFSGANHPSTTNDIALSESWENNKHFLLIESENNLGFCAGNNLGMEWAAQLGANYILILNNDTLVQPDFLEPMVEIAENDYTVGLVGGVITYYDDPQIVWWAGGKFDRFLNAERLFDRKSIDRLTIESSFETEWISGCMMLIPTRIYLQFGGYFEDYFIWSEEWDYSLMVSQAGYKLMVASQSQICHKVGRSLGIMKPLNYYYGIRNGLIFQRKYLTWYYWYPYLIYYLINRTIRYAQLMLQGRSDLVHAGVSAIADFLQGRTGIWRHQVTQ